MTFLVFHDKIIDGRYAMCKLKVYLETSVVSYLYQLDTPEKMKDTLELWELFR